MATYRGESCSGHEYSIFLNHQTMFRLEFKYCKHNCNQWRSQDFSLEETRLKKNTKNKSNLKILIDNKNKINRELSLQVYIHIIKTKKQK